MLEKKLYICLVVFHCVFLSQRKTFVSRNKPPITRSLVRKVKQLFQKRIHAVTLRFLYRIRIFYYRILFFALFSFSFSHRDLYDLQMNLVYNPGFRNLADSCSVPHQRAYQVARIFEICLVLYIKLLRLNGVLTSDTLLFLLLKTIRKLHPT